ncbi:MAG: pirin family protein [Stellaceae bacterium]
MSESFVLRGGDRGYTRLVSTGPNASYVAGHPDGVITRHSSFNFHEYQSGRAGFGKIRVFGDEVFTGNGTGYNMHPHHNFIIMAVVLRGALTHINTIGKIDVLLPGDYYSFSAGSGGKHSELNIEPEDLQVIYIWALPDRLATSPTYHRGHFDATAQANELHCLIGDAFGALPIRQDLSLHRLVSAAGRRYTHRIRARHGLYLFLLEGAAEIDGTPLGRRDGIGMTGGVAGSDQVEIAVTAEETDLLLVDTVL